MLSQIREKVKEWINLIQEVPLFKGSSVSDCQMPRNLSRLLSEQKKLTHEEFKYPCVGLMSPRDLLLLNVPQSGQVIAVTWLRLRSVEKIACTGAVWMVLINNTSRDPDQAEFHFKLIPFIGVIQTVIERGLHEEENIDLIRFSPLLTWNLKNKIRFKQM